MGHILESIEESIQNAISTLRSIINQCDVQTSTSVEEIILFRRATSRRSKEKRKSVQ
jgi:hypothetical protein